MAEQSFSAGVRAEAAGIISQRRHCNLAELAGIVSMCGTGDGGFLFSHENPAVAKKVFTLIKKTFKILPGITVRKKKGRGSRRQYIISVSGEASAQAVFSGIKLQPGAVSPVSEVLLTKSCCRRAFVRGAFLAAGSVTDPEKRYHLEIVCPTRAQAEQLCRMIGLVWDDENADIRYTVRNKKDAGRSYVVYIKEGDRIADLLNACECTKALLDMENIRVRKEIANSVNRAQNCDVANMVKTISAASSQIGDISFIDGEIGLERLPAELAILGRLRLDNPDMTLQELGDSLDPPVGKSCVNHRMRRLKKIAEGLRRGESADHVLNSRK